MHSSTKRLVNLAGLLALLSGAMAQADEEYTLLTLQACEETEDNLRRAAYHYLDTLPDRLDPNVPSTCVGILSHVYLAQAPDPLTRFYQDLIEYHIEHAVHETSKQQALASLDKLERFGQRHEELKALLTHAIQHRPDNAWVLSHEHHSSPWIRMLVISLKFESGVASDPSLLFEFDMQSGMPSKELLNLLKRHSPELLTTELLALGLDSPDRGTARRAARLLEKSEDPQVVSLLVERTKALVSELERNQYTDLWELIESEKDNPRFSMLETIIKIDAQSAVEDLIQLERNTTNQAVAGILRVILVTQDVPDYFYIVDEYANHEKKEMRKLAEKLHEAHVAPNS